MAEGPASSTRCGIDTVEIARIERLLADTPAEDLPRIFSAEELRDAGDGPGRSASLAARFAAKEACLKLFPRETALGMITVVGTAAETSAVMLAYLDEACKRRKAAGGLTTLEDVVETVHRGALERIRPMAMIGIVDVLGLIPVMLATGTGADVMKRVAAPQVGGVLSAMILTLFVIPAVYVIWRWSKERKEDRAGALMRPRSGEGS